MILLRFPPSSHPATDAFVYIVMLVILGTGFLAFKITRGYAFNYLEKDIPDRLKTTMLLFQTIGSFLFAMITPNNYLVDIEYFGQLYKQNGLWIALSMLVLLFGSVLLTGFLFSIITRGRGKRGGYLK